MGTPPSPRYAHSATYIQNFNIIVIYGGKDSLNNFFDDIHILNI